MHALMGTKSNRSNRLLTSPDSTLHSYTLVEIEALSRNEQLSLLGQLSNSGSDKSCLGSEDFTMEDRQQLLRAKLAEKGLFSNAGGEPCETRQGGWGRWRGLAQRDGS